MLHSYSNIIIKHSKPTSCQFFVVKYRHHSQKPSIAESHCIRNDHLQFPPLRHLSNHITSQLNTSHNSKHFQFAPKKEKPPLSPVYKRTDGFGEKGLSYIELSLIPDVPQWTRVGVYPHPLISFLTPLLKFNFVFFLSSRVSPFNNINSRNLQQQMLSISGVFIHV